MDLRDDHGYAQQVPEEPSQKKICTSIDKGKGKVTTTNDNICSRKIKDKGQMMATSSSNSVFQNYSSGQYSNYAGPLIISSSPGQGPPTMLFEQQIRRQIPVGNPSITSFPMAQPSADDWRQQIPEFSHGNNINPNVVRATSFQELMNAGGRGSLPQHNFPSIGDFRGGIESENLMAMRAWVTNVRQFWELAGCSLILDGWDDEVNGKTLLNVLVDCALGTVYLMSLDVTHAVNNVQAMELIVEGIIIELGTQNVQQVISYSASPWLDAVGDRIKARHQSMFWSVSASYCLTLILERVASSMSWVSETIEQAKRVTRIVNMHPGILDILRKKGKIREDENYCLVKFAKFEEATPFLTLENMLLRRKELQTMFTSQLWKDSCVGSSPGGKRVAKLVNDKSFWTRVTHVVKGAMPIVNMLCLINDGNNNVDKPQMGILYETMDQMKETIREEIGKKKAEEFWVIIDEVWNKVLHSPLHAAGYYLNPKLFYSKDFVGDDEVVGGVMATVLKFGGDKSTQREIIRQLKSYQILAVEDFRRGMKERAIFSPIEWWRRFGNNCLELQRFAVKVLGLTCNGAPSYDLRREVAENLFTIRETHPLHQWFAQKCFVSYNLHLKERRNPGFKFNIEADELHPSNDWIAGPY